MKIIITTTRQRKDNMFQRSRTQSTLEVLTSCNFPIFNPHEVHAMQSGIHVGQIFIREFIIRRACERKKFVMQEKNCEYFLVPGVSSTALSFSTQR
jgi:hypothetical protein